MSRSAGFNVPRGIMLLACTFFALLSTALMAHAEKEDLPGPFTADFDPPMDCLDPDAKLVPESAESSESPVPAPTDPAFPAAAPAESPAQNINEIWSGPNPFIYFKERHRHRPAVLDAANATIASLLSDAESNPKSCLFACKYDSDNIKSAASIKLACYKAADPDQTVWAVLFTAHFSCPVAIPEGKSPEAPEGYAPFDLSVAAIVHTLPDKPTDALCPTCKPEVLYKHIVKPEHCKSD